MEEFKFKKHTGRETAVRVISERKIGGGTFADAKESIVEVGGRRRVFVVKEYVRKKKDGQYYGTGDPKVNALNSFFNYTKAKLAGLKVFPTCRIGEDGKSLLMTTGFSDDQLCIGSNSLVTLKDLNSPKIRSVENLEEFLKNYFEQAVLAAKFGCGLYLDVPFFFITKNEPRKIDFVLGDYDNLNFPYALSCQDIKKLKNGATKSSFLLVDYGLRNLREALIDFCNENVDPSYRLEFMNHVNEKCAQISERARIE